jgi:phosphatidylglycerophosphatase A
MIDKFNVLFLTFFNVGKSKYAPGTIASLLTCIIYFILEKYLDMFSLLIFISIIFFYSLFAINRSVEFFDSKDPQEIVIDEVVGQVLPLLVIPIYETLYLAPKIYYIIGAFLIFRFFDILKPFPINYVDKNITGAFGVMFDDILAGFFTLFILCFVFFFIGG